RPPPRSAPAGALTSEQRLDDLAGLGRWNDGHDLELDEVAPAQDPLLEQARVVALHQLEAAVEARLDPAADVREPVRRAASVLPEPPVHRLGVTVLEALDHHEEHRPLTGARAWS